CPVCEQLVTTPPPARRTPEVEAATAAREATREKQRQAEALARQNEDALTGEQARLYAARQNLGEIEARCAELEAGVAAGEKKSRRTLGKRAPEAEAPVETWIESRIGALARSRKANEEAKARQGKAEQALERAKAEEATARERLGEREASRERLT